MVSLFDIFLEADSQLNASQFRTGLCDAMALELHRLTQLPLGVWRGYYPDEDGNEEDAETYEDAHAVVIISQNPPKYIDVDGIHTGIPNNLMFNSNPTRIELVKLSSEEMQYTFSMEGVNDEQLDLAKQYINSDHRLKNNIKEYIK